MCQGRDGSASTNTNTVQAGEGQKAEAAFPLTEVARGKISHVHIPDCC